MEEAWGRSVAESDVLMHRVLAFCSSRSVAELALASRFLNSCAKLHLSVLALKAELHPRRSRAPQIQCCTSLTVKRMPWGHQLALKHLSTLLPALAGLHSLQLHDLRCGPSLCHLLSTCSHLYSNLTNLCLTGALIERAAPLRVLAGTIQHLTKLQTIDLSGNLMGDLDPAVQAALEALPALCELHLADNCMTPASWPGLLSICAASPALHILDLTHNRLTRSAAHLATLLPKLTMLDTLRLGDNPMHNLAALSPAVLAVTACRALDLCNSIGGGVNTAGLPGRFYVHYGGFTAEFALALAALTQLTMLRITGHSIMGHSAAQGLCTLLSALSNLAHFDLAHTDASSSNLTLLAPVLGGLHLLTHLRLAVHEQLGPKNWGPAPWHRERSEEQWNSVALSCRMVQLSLAVPHMHPWPLLHNLPCLTRLHLTLTDSRSVAPGHCGLVTSLAALTSLRAAKFRFLQYVTSMTLGQLLVGLAVAGTLTSLSISHSGRKLHLEDWETTHPLLRRLPLLRCLCLDTFSSGERAPEPPDARDWSYSTHALLSLTALTKLHMCGCWGVMGPPPAWQADAVVQALARLTRLRVLKLGGTSVEGLRGMSAAQKLIGALAHLHRLTLLDLAVCDALLDSSAVLVRRLRRKSEAGRSKNGLAEAGAHSTAEEPRPEATAAELQSAAAVEQLPTAAGFSPAPAATLEASASAPLTAAQAPLHPVVTPLACASAPLPASSAAERAGGQSITEPAACLPYTLGSVLANLAYLQVLVMKGCSSQELSACLWDVQQLTYLDASGVRVDGVGSAQFECALQRLPGLGVLILDGAELHEGVSKSMAHSLCELTSLFYLSATRAGLFGDSFQHLGLVLSELTGLRMLRVFEGNQLGNAEARELVGCVRPLGRGQSRPGMPCLHVDLDLKTFPWLRHAQEVAAEGGAWFDEFLMRIRHEGDGEW